jgi:uncharacterized protein (TIGR03382 family)
MMSAATMIIFVIAITVVAAIAMGWLGRRR